MLILDTGYSRTKSIALNLTGQFFLYAFYMKGHKGNEQKYKKSI